MRWTWLWRRSASRRVFALYLLPRTCEWVLVKGRELWDQIYRSDPWLERTGSIGRETSNFRSSYWMNGVWSVAMEFALLQLRQSNARDTSWRWRMWKQSHTKGVSSAWLILRRIVEALHSVQTPWRGQWYKSKFETTSEWNEWFGTWGLILVFAWTSSFKRCPSKW